MAPRFAKNTTRSEAIKPADCSVEELPDGYIKIRSKNLDIIFKKEFYHKRMMELQVRGITPNIKSQVREETNEANLSTSSSINIPDNSGDPASFTVGSMSSFIDLDLDEIPEFRPRLGTDVASINDSGYSSSFQESFCFDKQYYPPQPQCLPPQGPVFLPPPHLPPPVPQPPMCPFYLFSAATNTLIPCEEVLVSQSLETPGGPIFQGHTKAYVAYPVQGPEGRGYIMQPFAPPPELSSSPERDTIAGNLEVVNEGEGENESFKEVLNKSTSQHKPGAKSRKIDHVILPNVYIPGLPPSEMKVKKKKKKKPKSKSDQTHSMKVSLPSSSESDAKEFEPVNYQQAPVSEELFDFTTEETVNEINLTDDLTNSLLNPPTEDDEIESSALVREIINLVDEDLGPVEMAASFEAKEVAEEPNRTDATESVVMDDLELVEVTLETFSKPKSSKLQKKQKKQKKKVGLKFTQSDESLALQPATNFPAVVNHQEDKLDVCEGPNREVSPNEVVKEASEPTPEMLSSEINETEVKLEKEQITTIENPECPPSKSDEVSFNTEAEPSPPPNVPGVRNKNKDGKGRRRKKPSSKDINTTENPQKVLVQDNQVTLASISSTA